MQPDDLPGVARELYDALCWIECVICDTDAAEFDVMKDRATSALATFNRGTYDLVDELSGRLARSGLKPVEVMARLVALVGKPPTLYELIEQYLEAHGWTPVYSVDGDRYWVPVDGNPEEDGYDLSDAIDQQDFLDQQAAEGSAA